MGSKFETKRRELVEQMQATGAIASPEIKEAFLALPREHFFPSDTKAKAHAYADNAFPIGHGQTISQPSTIATMLELLQMKKGLKILEIGSGSGYALALLAVMAGKQNTVFGVEWLPALVTNAKSNLQKAKIKNIAIKQGNGCLGWKEHAPFERILISAACEKIPFALRQQLAENGLLVAPVGPAHTQELVAFRKHENELVIEKKMCCYVFVPLICD